MNLNQTRDQWDEQWDERYAAGFFDGEGCVNITRAHTRTKEPHYRLQVAITNTDPWILEWFQTHCGGKVYEVSNNRSNLTEYPRQCMVLFWHGREAAENLRRLEPNLRVKYEQARNALAFQAIKERVRRMKTRGTPSDLQAQLARHYELHRRLSSRTNAPGALLEALAYDEASDQLELLP